MAAILFPSSLTNVRPKVPHVPKVSSTTGTKSWAVAKDAYFWTFTLSADAAAELAATADFFTCDGASVSGTVASQRRQRPRVHGTNVAASGLLASARVRPGGSRTAAI